MSFRCVHFHARKSYCMFSESAYMWSRRTLTYWHRVQTHGAVVCEYGRVYVVVGCALFAAWHHDTLHLLNIVPVNWSNTFTRVPADTGISSSSTCTALMLLWYIKKKDHLFDTSFFFFFPAWVRVPQSIKLPLVCAVKLMLQLTEVGNDGAMLKWQALMRNNSSYYSVPCHTSDWSTIFFFFRLSFFFSGREAVCKGGLIIKNLPSSKLSRLAG